MKIYIDYKGQTYTSVETTIGSTIEEAASVLFKQLYNPTRELSILLENGEYALFGPDAVSNSVIRVADG